MDDHRKTKPQQVARAGEYFVTAEIQRRGANAVTLGGNMPDIDVLATNTEQTRTISIQVKTKSGTSPGWQTQTTRGQQRSPVTDGIRFWVLVDLGDIGSAPGFYVIPEWWMQNDIYEAYQEYIAKHGGHRPVTEDSKHHKIDRRRVEEWRDRWDLLEIFSSPEEEAE